MNVSPSSAAEASSLAVQASAFRQFVTAWEAFEEIQVGLQRKDPLALGRVLQQCLDAAAASTTTLYSGAPDQAPEFKLLQHLQQKDPILKRIPLDFWTRYLRLKQSQEPPESTWNEWSVLAGETEKVLEALEEYQFQLKRQIYYTASQQLEKQHKQRLLGLGVLLIGLFFLGLYPIYKTLQPLQIHQTKGQFFWSPAEATEESEERSLHFGVIEDGEFHEYIVEASVPLSLERLRFDPVEERNAEVWIDFIEYYEEGQVTPSLIQSFEQKTEGWQALTDVIGLQVREGSLYFRTTGVDPMIRHEHLPLSRLIKLKLRVKVKLYQTYVQWLFS